MSVRRMMSSPTPHPPDAQPADARGSQIGCASRAFRSSLRGHADTNAGLRAHLPSRRCDLAITGIKIAGTTPKEGGRVKSAAQGWPPHLAPRPCAQRGRSRREQGRPAATLAHPLQWRPGGTRGAALATPVLHVAACAAAAAAAVPRGVVAPLSHAGFDGAGASRDARLHWGGPKCVGCPLRFSTLRRDARVRELGEGSSGGGARRRGGCLIAAGVCARGRARGFSRRTCCPERCLAPLTPDTVQGRLHITYTQAQPHRKAALRSKTRRLPEFFFFCVLILFQAPFSASLWRSP
jgi:hypothetical protein